ncbi:hypothetical protein Tco_1444762, partial [Tanacetum coccineum]
HTKDLCVCCERGKANKSWPFINLGACSDHLNRRIKLGELWDCQLGNLIAGVSLVEGEERAYPGFNGGKGFWDLPLLVPQGYKEYCKVGPCGDIRLGTWQFQSPKVIHGVAVHVLVSYNSLTLAALALVVYLCQIGRMGPSLSFLLSPL